MKLRLVLIVALVFPLLGIFNSAQADDAVPTPALTDIVLDTAFYKVRVLTYPISNNSPWVTSFEGNKILTMGPDSNFPDDQGDKLGGQNFVYPIVEFDTVSATQRSLGNIDLRPVVNGGGICESVFLIFSTFPNFSKDHFALQGS